MSDYIDSLISVLDTLLQHKEIVKSNSERVGFRFVNIWFDFFESAIILLIFVQKDNQISSAITHG
jgi:hypothetical protein